MRYKTAALALIFFTLCTLISARTWTDTQGRTMEAEIVRVDGAEVVFQKDTGLRYRFAIAQLSADDQALVQTFIAQSTASEQPTPPKGLEPTKMTEWLAPRLVVRKGSRLQPLSESRLPQSEYIAFYYSASWCPPCRTFTPELVKFYKRFSRKYDNFEIIFVSSDSSEDAQEDYMKDYDMPWPAIQFDDAKNKKIRRSSGGGIPCLLVIDREGNILEDSYENGSYRGPTSVMSALEDLIK